MAINLFGLTPADVRKHHFPMWDALSVSTKPTLATVQEKLEEAAGEIAGALNAEAIDAGSISDALDGNGNHSPAFVQCRRAVRTACALQLLWSATGLDPELAKAWREWMKAFFDGLDEGGATFLGGGATSTTPSDPDGPTSHISEYGLQTDSAADMSSAVPLLRKDDRL